jgi:subtilisin family serine protease
MISFQDGQILRSNGTTSINFPANPQQTIFNNAQTGGYVSIFSSWGPSNEVNINPHFGAPGGSIYSTYPLPLGGYNILSGTSMATPYITGVVALYLGNKGSVDPVKLRGLIATTAVPLDWNDGHQTSIRLKAPVSQQGGGLINAFRLIKATTVIEPAFIELNVFISFNLLTSRIPPTSKGRMR